MELLVVQRRLIISVFYFKSNSGNKQRQWLCQEQGRQLAFHRCLFLGKAPVKLTMCWTTFIPVEMFTAEWGGGKNVPPHLFFARDDSALTRCVCHESTLKRYNNNTHWFRIIWFQHASLWRKGEMFLHGQLHEPRNGAICIVSNLSGNQLVVCGGELTGCHLKSSPLTAEYADKHILA